MGGGWREPRWLIGVGVTLLVGGYAVLSTEPARFQLYAGPGRLAFYGGLVLLLAGVAVWLQQPPRPGPTEDDDAAGAGEE